MKYEAASRLTKTAFANALKEKMMEKPLSKITVTELIEACGFNRKTFYYHFEDMNALVAWMVHQETDHIMKQYDVCTDVEEIVRAMVAYIDENRYLCECIVNSIGMASARGFFVREFTQPLETMIQAHENSSNLPTEYKKFLIAFYTEALAGLLIRYVTGITLQEAPGYVEKSIRYLDNFLKSSLNYALTELPHRPDHRFL